MTDILRPGQSLDSNRPGFFLVNARGDTRLDLINGQLVLREKNKQIWRAPLPPNTRGVKALMVLNGDFVVYDAQNRPIWGTHTWNNPGASLLMQDDHNLVLYKAGEGPWKRGARALWASGTGHKDGFPLAVIADIASIAVGIPPGVLTAVRVASPQANMWVGNAVGSAGKAVGHVAHDIQTASGKLSDALSKIPVVGGLLHGLYDSAFFTTLGPIMMTEQVIIEGKRIDRVAMDSLKAQLRDFKEVGPYAQMICSFIPGVGAGISAAIGCGLALANGQPISEAILAGVKGALPGGPLAKMAFDVAESSIKAAIDHKPFSWQMIAQEGISAASTAIALPDIAKHALEGAMSCASMLIQGKRIEKALVGGFADALPIPKEAKMAMGDVLDISTAIAKGQRVDKVLLDEVNKAAKYLPVSDAVKKSITAGLNVSVGAIESKGKDIGKLLVTNVEHVVTDVLMKQGTVKLPKAAQDALNIGTSVVQGKFVQSLTKTQLVGPVMGKLTAMGQDIIKKDNVVGAAFSAVVKQGHQGFQVGVALMQHEVNVHQVMTVRQALSDADKVGFDMGVSMHIGRVATPPSTKVSDPKAQVGFFMTKGMQGGYPAQKTAMMSTMTEDSVVKLGAAVAVHDIATARAGWWHRLLLALGLVHEMKVAAA